MTKHRSGGCACGAIRYETNGEPIVALHCQCLDCQKRSGTGHSSYLVFPAREHVKITGEAKRWNIAGDSGSQKFHAFCPNCGTPVYLTFAANDAIAIHAGSLDDASTFRPQIVTYGTRAQPWDALDGTLKIFERMPG